MLNRVLIIFVLFPFFLSAQVTRECGNKMSSTQLQEHYARVQSVASLLPHDTCLHRELSVVFHVVLDSSGQTGIAASDLDICIDSLNSKWKPICIAFKKCSVNYIPNYNYNEWKDIYDEPTCFSNYCVDKTINIFLVGNIVTPSGAAGYAGQMGPSGCNKIVMRKDVFTSSTAIHEMGHFFGLPHTFEAGDELVRRVSCYTTGDAFCDTEADPHPQGEVTGAHCNFQPGPQDANGDYYTPPLDNFMTYFKPCRCRFTQEQYNFMAWIFITQGTSLH